MKKLFKVLKVVGVALILLVIAVVVSFFADFIVNDIPVFGWIIVAITTLFYAWGIVSSIDGKE